MSLLDLLRQEYVSGSVVEKYVLENGNVGVVVDDGQRRYHFEFKGGYSRPSLGNFFGLFRGPFSGKLEQLEKLVKVGDRIGVTVNYARTPFREAYRIHSVSRPRGDKFGDLPFHYRTAGIEYRA